MNYKYAVMWYISNKVSVSKKVFDSMDKAERYGNNQLKGIKRDYSYKVIVLD
jgi:hypothetical protein